MISQAELLARFASRNSEKFNDELFTKKDADIIRELQNVILSCERDKFFTIKVVKFRVINDYFEVQEALKEYEESSSRKGKNRRKENSYEYINLKDSDINLLVVTYFISIKGVSDYLNVYIAVPRIVNKFYFRLSGSIYSPMYQIVEASTYNNTTSINTKHHRITFRTILANMNMYRNNITLKTTEKEQVKCIYYLANVFSKSLPAMKYLLAKYGYYETLKLFGIPNYIISITSEDPHNPEMYTFMKKDDLYISIYKYIFDNNSVIQSLIYTIYQSIIRATKCTELFTHEFWIRSLGMNFNNDSVEKGLSVLDSIEHIYDISTREMIRLPEEMKQDIYHILKWMMCEFSNLRIKDNLDLATKRIRFAEYIAAMYAVKLSKGIYRIADLGNRADIDSIRKAINIAPMYLVDEIQKSKLVNYRDMVNDSDCFDALKFTYKGIAGIGEKSSSSVPDIFRAVNVSHLGRVDLNASSASDPGLSGILCPLGTIYKDGFFDDYKEPTFWDKEVAELFDNHRKMKGLKEIYTLKQSVGIKDDKYNPEELDDMITLYRRVAPRPDKLSGDKLEDGVPLEEGGVIRYGS